MKKLAAAIAVAALIACAVLLFLQNQAQEKLRADAELLRQQIAQLKADNEKLSTAAAQAKSSSSLPDEQFTELLKLRGEVGVLRRQTNEIGKLREENLEMRKEFTDTIRSLPSPEQALFNKTRINTINTMKQLGLAMRVYAGDNNDQYATNFDQLKNELGGVTNFNGIFLDSIEFVNAGLVNDSMPDKIIFRERVARQSPDGKWERVYGLADGSAWYQTSDDGNFDAYEKQHMVAPPPNQ